MIEDSYLDKEQLEAAAEKLKALSHPIRIAIVNLLSDKKKLTVTSIYRKLNLPQATASNHLSILKNKGIIESRRFGKNIFYSIKHKAIKDVIKNILKNNLL